MTSLLPTSTFPYQPFTPSPSTSFPYFVRPEPVDAQHQHFQPFHMAPQTTTLSAGASAIYGKLKERSALHIRLLGEDVERLRDFNPGFEADEKDSILCDVGILLQLRTRTAKSALASTKGPEDKLCKVKNKKLKKLIEKMRAKNRQFEDYITVVEDNWREFDTRKMVTGKEGVRYHKDVSLLMQFSAEQRCAVVEKLLGLVQTGVIVEDKAEMLMGRTIFEFYFLKEEMGKWVVAAQQGGAGGEPQVEAVGQRVVAAAEVGDIRDKKRKAENDAIESKERKAEDEAIGNKEIKAEDDTTPNKKIKTEDDTTANEKHNAEDDAIESKKRKAEDEAIGSKKIKTDDDTTANKKRRSEDDATATNKHETEHKTTGSKKRKAEEKGLVSIRYGKIGGKHREWVHRDHVPKPAEFKCAKCGWYSLGQWCLRTERGRAICTGRRDTS